jgi:hypothetical protein
MHDVAATISLAYVQSYAPRWLVWSVLGVVVLVVGGVLRWGDWGYDSVPNPLSRLKYLYYRHKYGVNRR